MLVWITQLGLNVASPLAGFVLLGVWLNHRFSLGKWVIILGCLIGLISAAEGLRSTLKAMERMDRRKDSKDKLTAFNHHE